MRGRRVPAETLASALLDAVLMGDKAAAKKHGISVRLLRRGREEGTAAPEVASVCSSVREQARSGLRRVMAVIIAQCEGKGASLPEVVEAARFLNTVDVQREAIDARRGQPSGTIQGIGTGRPPVVEPVRSSADHLDAE